MTEPKQPTVDELEKKEEELFRTGPLSVLTTSVKSNSQVWGAVHSPSAAILALPHPTPGTPAPFIGARDFPPSDLRTAAFMCAASCLLWRAQYPFSVHRSSLCKGSHGPLCCKKF